MGQHTVGQALAELAQGQFLKVGKIVPCGSLEARKLSSGAVQFYWRVTIAGKTAREPVGIYDASAPPKALKPGPKGYSVQAAIRAAERLAEQHHGNRESGGYVAIKAAAAEAKRQNAAEREDAAKYTLERLLTDYCDHLEALERRSHRDARSIFNLHVIAAWPKVAALPAKEVTGEQFADMMRKLIEAGKGRTANKLRSYARSAYQTAKAAKSKPSIPVAFKRFGITVNPVADTEPDESQNRPDKRPMSATELRAYWKAISAVQGTKGALLRLHLLTGGQRIEQLVNLRTSNIAADSILLHDGKGRPGRPPRPHTVPLTEEAAKALAECNPEGDFALSSDGGKTHIAATTLSAWAVEAVGTTIKDFQAKRIRSGIETMLAAAGVSQVIRGRLQSHGVSGVQARHYDC